MGDDAAGTAARLRAVLEAYERWEADMCASEDAWAPGGMAEFPRLTQALYDELIRIQGLRNRALGRFAGRAGCRGGVWEAGT